MLNDAPRLDGLEQRYSPFHGASGFALGQPLGYEIVQHLVGKGPRSVAF